MTLTRHGDLDITYTPGWFERWSRWHRAMNALAVVILVAAVLGLFGEGPLAHATKSAGGGALTVDYDRFVRTAASTSLTVQVQGHAKQVRIAISNGYLDRFSLGQITPQPDSEEQGSDRATFTWNAKPPQQVEFYLVPRTIGLHGGSIWAGSAKLSFHQFVYP